jgi:nucleotide-binding universal stress UspA family protein
MKSRLIALIDFSVYSHAIAEVAVRLASIAQAKLVLVHQVPGLVPGMADDASKKEILKGEKEEALEKLKKFTAEKDIPHIVVRYVVTESHLLTTIDELLAEGFNDTILVGIRGAGMLRQLFIGNTATMIINEVNRTVVAVPEKLCAIRNEFCNVLPKRLVVSLSYRFPLNEEGLDNFLTQHKSDITQVEFISSIDGDEKEEKADQYLSSLAEKYGMNFKSSYKIFKGKKHFEQIKKYVQSEPNTVLIVQKGSRYLTDMLFRSFLINEVVQDGSLPMVVLPNLRN